MGLKWVAKAAVQKGISVLPGSDRLNHVLQQRVSRSVQIDDEFIERRVEWAGMHLQAFRRHGRADGPFTAVELGTGWFPFVPSLLYLAGAEQVRMLDRVDHGQTDFTLTTIDRVLERVADGSVEAHLGPVDPERVRRLGTAREQVASGDRVGGLASVGLDLCIGDATTLELDDVPDLICSNAVFEHLPRPVLEGILRRFEELSTPGTVMSHLVDMCDHYAYADSTVGVYHFLRYSDRAWKLIDNDLQPLNRLRANEYRDLYQQLGIPVTEEHLTANSAAELDGTPLAPRFAAMDLDDVAATTAWFVSASA